MSILYGIFYEQVLKLWTMILLCKLPGIYSNFCTRAAAALPKQVLIAAESIIT